jgi:hypothetical protein
MATSLLAPAYDLTLATQRWTTQATSVTVELEPVPLLDVVRVALPPAAPVEAQVGDPMVLSLDAGDGAVPVFHGRITRLERRADATLVRGLDAGGQLAALRPSITFETATVGSIVRALCDEVGVGLGQVDDGSTLVYYAADPRRTALDHLGRLAAWCGALASVDGEGRLQLRVVDAAEPEVALRFGRELVAIQQAAVLDPAVADVVAGESGTGDASAPEALRPTTDFFAGDRPDGPSADHRWTFEPALRTTGAAAVAGAARARAARSTRGAASFDARLLPALRPGTVLEVQDLPSGLTRGPFWVEGVRHRIDASGATTRVRLGGGGDRFDPSSLLGSLAGAIGGLTG